MTTDLTAQALEWIAHRESLAESRRRLIELYRMPLQDNPQHEVAEDLPEPLRSEVLKLLSH